MLTCMPIMLHMDPQPSEVMFDSMDSSLHFPIALGELKAAISVDRFGILRILW